MKNFIHYIFLAMLCAGVNSVYAAAPGPQELHILQAVQARLQMFLDSELQVAARNGHLQVVEYLVMQGANKEAGDHGGFTALMDPAAGGHAQIVEYLVRNGTNKEAANSLGWTALMMAAEEGHLQVVELLLQDALKNKKRHYLEVIKALNCMRTANKKLKFPPEILDNILGYSFSNVIFMRNEDGKNALDVATSDEMKALLIRYHELDRKVNALKVFEILHIAPTSSQSRPTPGIEQPRQKRRVGSFEVEELPETSASGSAQGQA